MCSTYPEGRVGYVPWDIKMNFWTQEICRFCASRKTAVFNISQLQLGLQRHGVMPQCLGTVVQHMLNCDLVRHASDLAKELDPSGTRWSFWDLIRKPVSLSFNWCIRKPTTWVFRKLYNGKQNEKQSNGSDVDEDSYVLVELVKSFSVAIHNMNRTLGNSLIAYRDLQQMSTDIVEDENSFRLAIMHLSAQNRCIITNDADGQKILKLIRSEDELIKPTRTELQIFRLKQEVKKLESSLENIPSLMARYHRSAKACMMRGNRDKAVGYLKRRKELEYELSHKQLTITRIQTLVTSVEEIQMQKELLKIYKIGNGMFKAMKRDFVSTTDEVDQTTQDMLENIDDIQEMRQTMTLAFNGPSISSIEEDLETLDSTPEDIMSERPSASVLPNFVRVSSPRPAADEETLKLSDVPVDEVIASAPNARKPTRGNRGLSDLI